MQKDLRAVSGAPNGAPDCHERRLCRPNKLLYCFFALMAGAALALELAFGGILGLHIGRLETSWLIFVVGLAVFLPYVLLFKRRSLTSLKGLRKWEYCGGLLGATYLVLLLVCVTKVGVGLSMAAVIVGQLAMGAVLEQFGWINLKVAKFNYNTLIAFVLLIAALALIIE